MNYRFVHSPTEQEYQQLERMTQQEVGRVALRAHMILLSSRGFTVPEITRIHDTSDTSLYVWFDRFDEQGPEGLFDRARSGRPPQLDAEALAELERVLERSPLEEGYSFTTWTTPLLKSHLRARLGVAVSEDTVRRALRRLEFVWRRPRWKIDYEDPRFEERMEAILAALEEAQQSEEPITVLFEDETTLRRLPPLGSMWMRRGQQARVSVPSSNDKFSLYGVLDPHSGQTFTASYPKAKSLYTKAFLERVLERFEGTVLVIWDHARWHTSKMVEAVVEGYERLRVLLLPKRAPQENPVEDLWRHLKRVVAANLERGLEALKAACRAFFEQLSKQEALRMAGLAA